MSGISRVRCVRECISPSCYQDIYQSDQVRKPYIFGVTGHYCDLFVRWVHSWTWNVTKWKCQSVYLSVIRIGLCHFRSLKAPFPGCCGWCRILTVGGWLNYLVTLSSHSRVTISLTRNCKQLSQIPYWSQRRFKLLHIHVMHLRSPCEMCSWQKLHFITYNIIFSNNFSIICHNTWCLQINNSDNFSLTCS